MKNLSEVVRLLKKEQYPKKGWITIEGRADPRKADDVGSSADEDRGCAEGEMGEGEDGEEKRLNFVIRFATDGSGGSSRVGAAHTLRASSTSLVSRHSRRTI